MRPKKRNLWGVITLVIAPTLMLSEDVDPRRGKGAFMCSPAEGIFPHSQIRRLKTVGQKAAGKTVNREKFNANKNGAAAGFSRFWHCVDVITFIQ